MALLKQRKPVHLSLLLNMISTLIFQILISCSLALSRSFSPRIRILLRFLSLSLSISSRRGDALTDVARDRDSQEDDRESCPRT